MTAPTDDRIHVLESAAMTFTDGSRVGKVR